MLSGDEDKKFFSAMAYIGKIEEFEAGENFESYVDRLEIFFELNNISNENKKTLILLNFIGRNTYEILKSLVVPESPNKKEYTELVKVLSCHFNPRINKRAERYKFNKCIQLEGETITDFVIKLKALAQPCGFGDYLTDADTKKYKNDALNDALTDRFIVGLKDENILCELLKDDTLKFDDYCQKALNMEMSSREAKALQPLPQFGISQVKNIQSHRSQSRGRNLSRTSHKNSKSPSQENKQQFGKCYRCGRLHNVSTCPAVNWQCYACSKMGHTSNVCRNTENRKRNIKSIYSVVHSDALTWKLQVEHQELEFEVDSGACATIITDQVYSSLFSNIILNETCSNLLFTVTGQAITTLGSAKVKVFYGGKQHSLEILVIKSEKKLKPLLGRSWLDTLCPNWRNLFKIDTTSAVIKGITLSQVNSEPVLSNSNITKQIQQHFPEITVRHTGEPIVGYKAEIVLKENVSPIFHKAYSVPYKYRDIVSKALDELVEENKLVPIKYSAWASPIVVVPKPTGEIRICIDCRATINKKINCDYYPLPNIEDIFAGLANSIYFCVIDLSGAYMQLSVTEKSRELLTINTHKGLFQYTRLPFGVSSAPAIFQSVMDRILLNLDKVFCYLDDIIIGGTSLVECKNKLFEVLGRLQKHKIKINLEKCKFLEKEVQYLGHVLSGAGIQPNAEKVNAIVNAPAPTNINELQSFLGLLNYYSRFIPNLATTIKDLYKLLEKNKQFIWSEACQKAFNKGKSLLVSHPILELYDSKRPICIATDASPYGVGAVLSHLVNGIEKPVMFASSSLSKAEQNYSQLHREALAIIFALKKFHKYIYGHQITIFTDHQALKEIFSPRKNTPAVAAARLQRWAVILSQYDYKLEYRKGSLMGNADALSRLPLKINTEVENCDSINFITNTEQILIDKEKIKHEMKKDKHLLKILNYTLQGWPKKYPDALKPYAKIQKSISCEDDCLFYGNRIVIPEILKKKILELLHESHAGVVKMKMIARSYVWWCNIDKQIEEYVKQCPICQQTARTPREIITTSWPPSTFPFERIHLDLFYFANLTFLVLVDSFSRYCHVAHLKESNANSVIKTLIQVWVTFGLPTTIVTDNGPPFASNAFKHFCSQNKIKLLKSPPYHPQSNGTAERYVQTVKSTFKKYLLDEKFNKNKVDDAINNFLRYHQHTPSTVTGVSPVECLFSYKPRSLLDLVNDRKQVKFNLTEDKATLKTKNINHRNNTYSRNNAPKFSQQNINYFKEGEKVLYRNHFKHYIRWIPARILKQLSNCIYLINVNNHVRRVHSNQIRYSSLADRFHPSIQINPVRIQTKLESPIKTPIKKNNQQTHQQGIVNGEIDSPEAEPTPIRRTVRNRKIPNRLQYT